MIWEYDLIVTQQVAARFQAYITLFFLPLARERFPWWFRPAPFPLWFAPTMDRIRLSSRSRDASITSDWRSPRATRLT
jgi:hypothetical protein